MLLYYELHLSIFRNIESISAQQIFAVSCYGKRSFIVLVIGVHLSGWVRKSCSRLKIDAFGTIPCWSTFGRSASRQSANFALRCGFLTHFRDPMNIKMSSKI